ncbi:hypothetical protein Trydic_g10404 [Trypoxylus dichotomus]
MCGTGVTEFIPIYSVLQKELDCLPESLSKETILSKCCSPNYNYEPKDHKCVESNSTNILEGFKNGSLLIKSGLSDCQIVLDHLLDTPTNAFSIGLHGSLHYNDRTYQIGSYCFDNNEGEGMVIRTCEKVDMCKNQGVRCIKKCCPDGQYYEGTTCSAGHQFGLSLANITRFKDPSKQYNAIFVSGPCSRYLDKPAIIFHITKDGTAVIREIGVWKHYLLEESYYCMEYVKILQDYKMLLCLLGDNTDTNIYNSKNMINKVVLIISCVCLLATVILYLILPDLKNFIGKIIICYCSCLFVAFLLLTWLRFDPFPGDYCDVFGFAIAFSFLAAFSWMTILSYEMWRVLGSMTAEYGNKLHTHKKRFMWYNIIGWTIPLALVSFTLVDYLYYLLPNSIHIIVGYRLCAFENNRSSRNYGYTLHFGVPCGIYLLINFIIFIKTIRYIYQVKNEIRHVKITDNHEKRRKWTIFNTDKERLKMVIRIFLVMGINFFFETFSSVFVDFRKTPTLQIVEIVFDAINALQGLFIFLIFLAKKKTWITLKQLINNSSRKSSIATNSTEVMASLYKTHPQV